MSSKDRSPEAQERQAKGIRSLYLPEGVYERVQQYAIDNGMSASEVMRDAMRLFRTREGIKGRKRRSRRVTMWVPLDEFSLFRKAVEDAGTTQPSALEAALEEIL